MKKILLIGSGSLFALSMLFSLFNSSAWYLYPLLILVYGVVWRFGKSIEWMFTLFIIGEIGVIAATQTSVYAGVCAQAANVAIFLVQMNIPVSNRVFLSFIFFILVISFLFLLFETMNDFIMLILIFLGAGVTAFLYIFIDRYRLYREYGGA